MRKGFLGAACLFIALTWLAGTPAAASPPLTQLFYERRWKEFDQALETRATWTPREACLAANAAWLRQDWEKAVRILSRYRKNLPGTILPYADLLRALGLERTGRAEEARRVAKKLWDSKPPYEIRYYVAFLAARVDPPAEKANWAREMLKHAGNDTGRKVQALYQVLSTSLGTEKDALDLLEIRPLDSRGLDTLKRTGKPKSKAALEALGMASALSGNPSEAVGYFEAVSPLAEGGISLTAKGKFWLALSLYRSDRKEEAIPLWEELARAGESYSVSSARRLASASAAGLVSARVALEGISQGNGTVAEAALFSLARADGSAPSSEWGKALFERFPGGSAASGLHWEIGWSHWKAGRSREAGAEWEKALSGVPEGLERARLLFWLSRAARMSKDEPGAIVWEKRLVSQEPLSVYAWRVFPQGPPGLAISGRKTWSKGADPLESWGFPIYARLRLEAKATGDSLARAAWLAAWNGDFAESVRLAARAGSLLPRSESLSPQFLSLTHPKAYPAEVVQAAVKAGIETGLVWAVMRQESAFDPGAVSSAGAMGLMQLMPATARDEGQRLGLSNADFWSPATNVLLGAVHLGRHLNSFGQVEKALAAYNAGGGSVRKWTGTGEGNLEEWIEDIPFPETNDYVRKVMGNLSIYNALEGRKGAGSLPGKETQQ
jgi:soluble lytic murein transglycosylase